MFKCLLQPLIQHQQVRTALWRNKRPILGWPRPTLARMGRKYPWPHMYNWLPYLPDDGRYTVRQLPIHKLGGRDMETGRVVVRTLGGGNVKRFRWIDMHRRANPDGSVLEERVLKISYDPLRTPKIALVAGPEKLRWVLASHGVKENDIIRTFSDLPRIPVRAKTGDAHPVGALAVGTKIHCVEIRPGEGAKFNLVAGSHSEIIKRTQEMVTIKLPHGDMYKIDGSCMAVVGQLSNIEHKDYHLWCPQRKRWLGKRPRSGLKHKKDGYCGRKLKKPKSYDYTSKRLLKLKQEEIEKEIEDLTL